MIQSEFATARSGWLAIQAGAGARWAENRALLMLMGSIYAVASVLLLGKGLWLIVPIAGLHFLALYVCLAALNRRLRQRQVLRFSDAELSYESGRRGVEKTLAAPRRHCYVLAVQRPSTCEIHLRLGDSEVELGPYLAPLEKQQLLAHLAEHLQVSRFGAT
jgi:uncharacterized membrane protein